jgi:ClpP class serine protease
VYVGVHAKSLGLVDQIGDLEDAIDLVCQLAEVARAKARIGFHQERAGGLGELIKELRGGGRDTRIGLEADTYEGEPGDPRGLSEILAGLVPRSLEERLAVVALLRTPTVLALWPWQGPLA